jgi:hypothetical protein
MTSETWDNVPYAVNSRPEKTKEDNEIVQDAERAEISGITVAANPTRPRIVGAKI